MKKGGHKIFNNKEQLCLMINLRRVGFSFETLALFFNCERSSIQSHCKEYGIENDTPVFSVANVIREINPYNPENDKWVIIDGERINRGKSYAEYLEEEKKRSQYPHSIIRKGIYT